jgi:predicted enzyme related to lactoylglutathione lyase
VSNIQTVLYPVSDIEKAKELFRVLAGPDPYMDEAYYVGWNADGQDIGLDPHGQRKGMTGPVAYWHVADINATLAALLEAGAAEKDPVRDVGGGKLVATVTDLDGNVIGILQAPST